MGRHDEVVELLAAIQQHRLLTLCGVGGSGKTRLALELASALTRVPPSLGVVGGPGVGRGRGAVANALADAMSVREVHDEQLLDTVAGELRNRNAVVVMDNCEQVLDGAAGSSTRCCAWCRTCG